MPDDIVSDAAGLCPEACGFLLGGCLLYCPGSQALTLHTVGDET